MKSWYWRRGHACGLLVPIDPVEADLEALLELSRRVEGHAPSRFQRPRVEFYSDREATRLARKRAKTEEDREYINDHWEGSFNRNAWSGHPEFDHPADAYDWVNSRTIRSHPGVRSNGGPAYVPPEYRDLL